MKNHYTNQKNTNHTSGNTAKRDFGSGGRRRAHMKKRVAIIASLGMVIVAGLLWNSFSVSAQDQTSSRTYKYYKSIQITSGDTLWGIAKEYRTSEYASTADYISELMRINNLSSDDIQDSQYLTVVYYDKDFK